MVRSYHFPTYIFLGRDEECQYWSFDWMASKRKIIQCDRLDSAFFVESCVFLFFFFPLFYVFQGGRRQNLLFMRQMSLFTHCFGTVYALFMEPTATLLKKYIKNRSHGTIHTFKNYFATVFSVFNFQFQQNKFYPNKTYIL